MGFHFSDVFLIWLVIHCLRAMENHRSTAIGEKSVRFDILKLWPQQSLRIGSISNVNEHTLFLDNAVHDSSSVEQTTESNVANLEQGFLRGEM